jgi:arsenite methyltransferase
MLEDKKVIDAVQDHYSRIAKSTANLSCCCGSDVDPDTEAMLSADPKDLSGQMGYSADEMSAVPDGANLGLGCGNPTALAGLSAGEVVVDLGSGAGFDAFLSAKAVGESGKVIGIDLNDDMLVKARWNAAKGDVKNVTFLKGDLTALPLEDNSANVVISNCVINLVPDKSLVYREALRVLKPGGRMEISDMISQAAMPDDLRENLNMVSCCIGGAATEADTKKMMAEAGFVDIVIDAKIKESKELIEKWGLDEAVADNVYSAYISGRKPE